MTRATRPTIIATVALCLGLAIGTAAPQAVIQVLLTGAGRGVYAQSSGLSAGDIVIRVSGSCGQGFVEVSALDGVVPQGTVAAHADQGTSGGTDTITPAGTNTAPTFTGNSVASSLVSGGTPAGTNATGTVTPTGTVAWPAGVPAFTGTGGTVPAQVFTGNSVNSSLVSAGTPAGTNGTGTVTPTGTVAWPAGVPTFAGSALGTHAHELPWQIPSTTTIRQIAVATFGTGTSRAATAVSAAGTANTTSAAVALSQAISAGTPAGSVAWPAGVPTFAGASNTTSAQTFTGSALGTHQHATTATGTNGTAAFTPAGTNAWPAGVPTFAGNSNTTSAQTFTGSALGTHQHTTTATGTNTAPTFTGTQFDNRAAFKRVIYCEKS